MNDFLHQNQLSKNWKQFTDKKLLQEKHCCFLTKYNPVFPLFLLCVFFYEEIPELHVIAAGSLLEFALQELPSFGVGRISSAFMYPLCFSEYLQALGFDAMMDKTSTATPEKPLSDALHTSVLDYLIQKSNKIIPIEVKSGTTGKMQSLHLFMTEKQSEYGIRTSLENFGQYNKIRVYPLYAIRQIIKY